jgi:hypothetical protein
MIFPPGKGREGEGILDAEKNNGGNMVHFRENAVQKRKIETLGDIEKVP